MSFFQTYAADFSLNFGDALKSCEQMEQEILAGKDVRGVDPDGQDRLTGGA